MAVDGVIVRADALSRAGQGDPALLSDLAKYATVLAAGYLETAVEEVILEYGRRSQDRRISTFLEERMRRFNNPARSRILDVLLAFDSNWQRTAKIYLHQSATHTLALESIMSNRHEIAHGGSSLVTLSQIATWITDVEPVVQFLWLLVLTT
jgi:RiboL-PSP-HEPN